MTRSGGVFPGYFVCVSQPIYPSIYSSIHPLSVSQESSSFIKLENIFVNIPKLFSPSSAKCRLDIWLNSHVHLWNCTPHQIESPVGNGFCWVSHFSFLGWFLHTAVLGEEFVFHPGIAFWVTDWLISCIWLLVPWVNPVSCLVGSFLGPRPLYTFLAARNICNGITYRQWICARNSSFTLPTEPSIKKTDSKHFHLRLLSCQCQGFSGAGPTINKSFDPQNAGHSQHRVVLDWGSLGLHLPCHWKPGPFKIDSGCLKVPNMFFFGNDSLKKIQPKQVIRNATMMLRPLKWPWKNHWCLSEWWKNSSNTITKHTTLRCTRHFWYKFLFFSFFAVPNSKKKGTPCKTLKWQHGILFPKQWSLGTHWPSTSTRAPNMLWFTKRMPCSVRIKSSVCCMVVLSWNSKGTPPVPYFSLQEIRP